MTTESIETRETEYRNEEDVFSEIFSGLKYRKVTNFGPRVPEIVNTGIVVGVRVDPGSNKEVVIAIENGTTSDQKGEEVEYQEDSFKRGRVSYHSTVEPYDPKG